MKWETIDAYVKIYRFTKEAVRLAKNAVGGRGEVTASEGGGGADYAVVSLHCLWGYLKKSYRKALNLLSEIRQVVVGIFLARIRQPFDEEQHIRSVLSTLPTG